MDKIWIFHLFWNALRPKIPFFFLQSFSFTNILWVYSLKYLSSRVSIVYHNLLQLNKKSIFPQKIFLLSLNYFLCVKTLSNSMLMVPFRNNIYKTKFSLKPNIVIWTKSITTKKGKIKYKKQSIFDKYTFPWIYVLPTFLPQWHIFRLLFFFSFFMIIIPI